LAGLKAEYLTSKNSKDRDKIRDQFKKKEFNYLFVVDILTKELIFKK
jgi:superfamily II DNA or RNA helicase